MKTVHIASRWYRAPELIIELENYTSKVDVWSIGCIIVEVLSQTKKY